MIPIQRGTAGPAVVVDASAMVEVLSGQPGHERLVAIMLDAPAALHAPATLDLEVLSAARRLERAERLDADRLREFLADFAEFRIERHGLRPLMRRVWSLRDWVRVSDGYYPYRHDPARFAPPAHRPRTVAGHLGRGGHRRSGGVSPREL